MPYIISFELLFQFKAESMRNSSIYLMRKLKRREEQVKAPPQLKSRSLSGYLCIFFPTTLVLLKPSCESPLTEKAAANLP